MAKKKAAAPAAPKKSKKKPLAPKPDKHTEMQLRHTFTPTETLEIAKKMAEASHAQSQAEDEKKAVTSQLKAKVDAATARVTELAGKINSGYEYRATKVTVKYHKPRVGMKTLIRDDTGEEVEHAEMSQMEMQDEMTAIVEAAAPKKPAGTVEAFPNPVLTPENAKKVKPTTGTVSVPADGDSTDDEK